VWERVGEGGGGGGGMGVRWVSAQIEALEHDGQCSMCVARRGLAEAGRRHQPTVMT
jgi:hypothetical protein